MAVLHPDPGSGKGASSIVALFEKPTMSAGYVAARKSFAATMDSSPRAFDASSSEHSAPRLRRIQNHRRELGM
jgi:hypothetical protein